MKIALCDDDEHALKSLSDLVVSFFYEKNITAEIICYASGAKLLQGMNGFDLIFLDIDMPEMDGIHLAKKIRDKDMNIKIIYATSYKKYLYQVFSVHPFGYMVKPITTTDVFKNLNDFLIAHQQSQRKNLLILPKGKSQIMYLPENIYFFEYCVGQGIKVMTSSGEDFVSSTLTAIFKQVEKYDFAFCHKGCIVNLEYIKRIKGLEITLTNDLILPIAQKRAAAFREIHHEFLQRRIPK